ncbi:unnamed protein product [Diamesa tonsa]
MECLNSLVTKNIPNYFAGLPIPATFGGWFKLGFKDWLALVPPTALLAGTAYTLYMAYCPEARPKVSRRQNTTIRLGEAKVVDMIDVEDIGEKAAFCRCWKTKNWPYCDGSHGEHNKSCGDNTGPVVVSRKQK